MRDIKINKRLLYLGGIFLIAGTVLYLVSRPVGSAHFLYRYNSLQLFFHQVPDLFGEYGMFIYTRLMQTEKLEVK